MEFIPTILSGGSGTRLWPLSRTTFPKQFCELLEDSLLSQTLKRLKPLGEPRIITHQSMKVLTDTSLRDAHLPPSLALYEPVAKNTAPAIALICRILEQQNQLHSIVGIFPSDHLITQEAAFYQAVSLGIECAKQGQVVTLGIRPTYPATGYGYIELDSQVFLKGDGPLASLSAYRTRGFREKPSAELAEKMVQAGNFLWNGGMFLFEVKTMIQHLSQLMPETWSLFSGLKQDLSNLSQIYNPCPAQSIDYGVMEKLQSQVCIPCDLGWNDVGSWDEIAKLRQSSEKMEIGGQGNFAFSTQGRITTFVDTSDVIVVDTADALLIAKKGSTQKVKAVVEKLQAQNDPRATQHPFEYRPWGKFEILRDTPRYKSKVIHVNPGQQLSYQSHRKRAEHWVITQGHPEVVLNDVVHTLQPGESIYIPQGAKHRIRNPKSDEVVEFIEVQVGTYFGEDDIIRYQDDYKRT